METDQYIGIDLHKAQFQVCALTPSGERLWEGQFRRTPEGIATWLARCTPQTAVAVEATTPTWAFVDAIQDRVGPVCVVDTRKTKLKAGYAAKTDRLDARRLADALRRGSVVSIYLPPPAVREVRELCRHRLLLTHLRSQVLQRMRALLLRHGVGDPAARTLRSQRGQRWLDTVSLPPRAAAALRTLRQVERDLTTQLAAVEADVQREAAADPIVQRLQTLPGVGPVVGLTLRAEIGDIRRFQAPAQLASYAGLVPRVERSAQRVWHGRITKEGSPWLRWALCTIGVHALRRPDARGRWARKLARRRSALVAQVAAARRACADILETWP